VVEVKATNGDTHLGGDDWDQRIVDYVAGEFKKEQGIDLRSDRQALQRLKEAAEKAKIELSSLMETEINLPFITADASGPKHLQVKLSRAKFEQLTEDLLSRCRPPFEKALTDAKLKASDIDEVVLVGGSTRMPMVLGLVRKLTNGKEPCRGVNPDEVVASGAALQAGVLSGSVKDVLLLDVTPLTLGVETLGGVLTPIIERNTTIPIKKAQIFSTAEDNQPAVTIHVLQGERPIAADNVSLGHFNLEGIPPASRGLPQIEVTFDIDANGILNVSARDQATGKEQTIKITASTNLSKEDIDRMVRQAEINKAADQRRKELIEARNQADSVAYSVEKTLSELPAGSNVGTEDRRALEQLIAEVRRAGKGEDVIAIRDALNRLQQAAYRMSEGMYERTDTGHPRNGSGNGQGPEGRQSPSGEDVVEGEFRRV
jgi:molecular chaperone DnaK